MVIINRGNLYFNRNWTMLQNPFSSKMVKSSDIKSHPRTVQQKSPLPPLRMGWFLPLGMMSLEFFTWWRYIGPNNWLLITWHWKPILVTSCPKRDAYLSHMTRIFICQVVLYFRSEIAFIPKDPLGFIPRRDIDNLLFTLRNRYYVTIIIWLCGYSYR